MRKVRSPAIRERVNSSNRLKIARLLEDRKMVKNCPLCGYDERDDAAFCSSCGASLAGAAAPVLKPVPSVRVVTPVTGARSIRVPAPGQCFYHPGLPAVYVCSRCGRSICQDDSKAYMDVVLCPQCYAGVAPTAAAPQPTASSFVPAYAPPLPMSTYASPPPMFPEAFYQEADDIARQAVQLAWERWNQLSPDERAAVLGVAAQEAYAQKTKDGVKWLVKWIRSKGREPAGPQKHCWICGGPVELGFRFCADCGAAVF